MLVDALGLPLKNVHAKAGIEPAVGEEAKVLAKSRIDAVPQNAQEEAKAVLDLYDEIVPREICEKFSYMLVEHQSKTEAETVLKSMISFANHYVVNAARMCLTLRVENSVLLSEVEELEARVKRLEAESVKVQGNQPVRKRRKSK